MAHNSPLKIGHNIKIALHSLQREVISFRRPGSDTEGIPIKLLLGYKPPQSVDMMEESTVGPFLQSLKASIHVRVNTNPKDSISPLPLN